ncbi:MAG: Mur ligase family protein, partial [Negativicoccus succinicivorans]|nr:Mur ligase family protein [Negativicoccus succinicivorans]
MNYQESIAWLTETAAFGIQPGLQRIKALLEGLGHPENAFKSIHVAGTNGKGSVTAMLESVLQQAGISCGRFTSPHLEEYTERIRINGADISPSDFAKYLSQVREVAEKNVAAGGEMATEFELLTACAFLAFQATGVEYAVVEVGMGGRLDSTNVIIPEVAVITNVSLDHTQYLGATVEEIAAEKAGIIKEDVPLVTSAHRTALKIIKEIAHKKNAPMYLWDRDFSVERR